RTMRWRCNYCDGRLIDGGIADAVLNIDSFSQSLRQCFESMRKRKKPAFRFRLSCRRRAATVFETLQKSAKKAAVFAFHLDNSRKHCSHAEIRGVCRVDTRQCG